MPYAVADARQKFRVASESAAKIPVVRELLARHHGEPALVIGLYVEQLAGGYLAEHFTQVEIDSLSGRRPSGFFGEATRVGFAARVASQGWPGDLLAATTDGKLRSWASARSAAAARGATLPRLRALRDLLELLRRQTDGIPLRELVARYQPDELPALADTIHLALATVVLFVGMRGHDLELMIGLWPEAAHELDRPPTARPHVVAPGESFTLAVMMEDMTAVLAAVSAAPVRVRMGDLSVFARTAAAIDSQLVAVPTWVESMVFNSPLTRLMRRPENSVIAAWSKYASCTVTRISFALTVGRRGWCSHRASDFAR